MKVIAQYTYSNKHAGPKAKMDVEKITASRFGADIKPFRCKKDANGGVSKLIYRLRKAFYMLVNRFDKTDILLIQAPFTKKSAIRFPSDRRIALIHDIDGLRNGDEAMARAELDIISSCDVVISHNSRMSDYLRKNGVGAQLVDLEVFDYLCEGDAKLRTKSFEAPRIVYAGNLEKSKFIHSIDVSEINYTFNLYGVGATVDINGKMCYKGAFSPDELPDMLDGDIGLVWDGDIDGRDADVQFKNYTRYNNPHKLSCYIAAGLPVIVWSQSAAAEFVNKYGIGYTVSGLYDINTLDFSDYDIKAKNAFELSKKIRRGDFTAAAVEKALAAVK